MSFNPFAGFLGAATPPRRDCHSARSKVSIPSRVFWVLRLRHDFSVILRRLVSIPSRVFWVLRRDGIEDHIRDVSFQSLRGFSGCCDRKHSN